MPLGRLARHIFQQIERVSCRAFGIGAYLMNGILLLVFGQSQQQHIRVVTVRHFGTGYTGATGHAARGCAAYALDGLGKRQRQRAFADLLWSRKKIGMADLLGGDGTGEPAHQPRIANEIIPHGTQPFFMRAA